MGGTYEELENLSVQLSAVKHSLNSATHGQQDASTHIKSMDVSAVVMTYIQQKCAKELNKIQGNSFVLETRPEHRTVHNNPSGTVQVVIRPQGVSAARPVHADYVRQRFITFYQRTASDLQVTSVPVSPHKHKDLQMRFPCILFKPSHGYPVTATGPFLHIAQLKKFLSQNTQSSSKTPVNKGSTDTPSSRTWGPQPTQDKDPEDELCPICIEPIAIKEKLTLQCKHSFCKDCLEEAYKYKPVCPTCGKLYGTLTGTQPVGGKMKVSRNDSSLPGYEKYRTITIHYDIQSGIQEVSLMTQH